MAVSREEMYNMLSWDSISMALTSLMTGSFICQMRLEKADYLRYALFNLMLPTIFSPYFITMALAPEFFRRNRALILAAARITTVIGADWMSVALIKSPEGMTIHKRLHWISAVPGAYYGLIWPSPESPVVHFASLVVAQMLWRTRWDTTEGWTGGAKVAAMAYYVGLGVVLPTCFNIYLRKTRRQRKKSRGALFSYDPSGARPSAAAQPITSFKLFGIHASDVAVSDKDAIVASLRRRAEEKLGYAIELDLLLHDGCCLVTVNAWSTAPNGEPLAATLSFDEKDILAALPDHLRARITGVAVRPKITVKPLASIFPIAAPRRGQYSASVRVSLVVDHTGAGAGAADGSDGSDSAPLLRADLISAWRPVAYFRCHPDKLPVSDVEWAATDETSGAIPGITLVTFTAELPVSTSAASLLVSLEPALNEMAAGPTLSSVIAVQASAAAELADVATEPSLEAFVEDLTVVVAAVEDVVSDRRGASHRAAWAASDAAATLTKLRCYAEEGGLWSTAHVTKQLAAAAEKATAAPRADWIGAVQRRAASAALDLFGARPRDGAALDLEHRRYRATLLRSCFVMTLRLVMTAARISAGWGHPDSPKHLVVTPSFKALTAGVQSIQMSLALSGAMSDRFPVSLNILDLLLYTQHALCAGVFLRDAPSSCAKYADTFRPVLLRPTTWVPVFRGPLPILDIFGVMAVTMLYAPSRLSLIMRATYISILWTITRGIPECHKLGYSLPIALTCAHLLAEAGLQWNRRGRPGWGRRKAQPPQGEGASASVCPSHRKAE